MPSVDRWIGFQLILAPNLLVLSISSRWMFSASSKPRSSVTESVRVGFRPSENPLLALLRSASSRPS